LKNNKDFESLITENHGMIYKICRVYADEAEFEDLYQEVLINLWTSLKNFKGNSKLSTWMYRVILNTALTYQRATKRHKNNTSIDQVPEPGYEVNTMGQEQQEIQRLYRAISKLALNDRSIILLYLEEKSYEEIAEITGLSISNIGVKINRLKKKIFKLLNP
jgi:RNA polymerase sigma-70 factor (ECF subfamily)